MPVNGSWYNAEKTVRWTTFVDPWSFAEFVAYREQSLREIDEVQHEVISVWDLSGSRALPNGALSFFQREGGQTHANVVQHVAIISHHPFMRIMARMLTSLPSTLSKKLYIVQSPEEAQAYIASLTAEPVPATE